jgi:hypothetical protein
MPSAQNQIQIVDTHETSETLAVTRLQRVGYQINRTLLILIFNEADFLGVLEAHMSITADFVRNRLDQMIDLRHPLAVLSNRMPW